MDNINQILIKFLIKFWKFYTNGTKYFLTALSLVYYLLRHFKFILFFRTEIDKKRMRDKTRKDKIRQGIHKLSELLPTEFHSKEGQKEVCTTWSSKCAPVHDVILDKKCKMGWEDLL